MKTKSNICYRLGQTIKKLRTEKGISQEKLALQIGLDRTYYSSVENGRRNISLINIEKIANGLNISLSELFREIEQQNQTKEADNE